MSKEKNQSKYYFRTFSNVPKLLDRLIKEKKTFELDFSNYSYIFRFADKVLYFSDTQAPSKHFFMLLSKLKKEINDKDIYFEEVVNLDYYKHNIVNYFDMYIDNCVCVDINKAYATTLKNMGLICNDTLQQINKLKKADRLKIVGALGASRVKLNFEQGEIKTKELKENKNLKNLFFNIAKYVGDVMTEAAALEPDNFLFFWVDGIFLKSYSPLITEFLLFKGYDSKIENITNFQTTRKKSCLYIDFLKDDKEKHFNIPLNFNHSKTIKKFLNLDNIIIN